MMNSIMGMINTVYQYHKAKQTGLAGLVGILTTLLIVWQWDHILPILKKMGVVAFFEKNGMIHDESYMTGYHIFSFIIKLMIVYCIALVILTFLFVLLAILFNSERFIKYVFLPILSVVAIPIITLLVIFDAIFNWKKHKQYTDEMKRKAHEDQLLSLKSMYEIVLTKNPALKELFEQESEQISKEEAFIHLNRLPMDGDDLYLLGFSNFGDPFILMPRPLNVSNDKFKSRELSCCKFQIEYMRPSTYGFTPQKYDIKWSDDNIQKYSFDVFTHFFVTSSDEMKNEFNKINRVLESEIYSEQQQYFHNKQKLLDEISNAETKEKFDGLVKQAAQFDVPNDEIVNMIFTAEKTTGV